jgi:hypothetical protein
MLNVAMKVAREFSPQRKRMSNEIDKASEEFVEALADVFEASKSGSPSLELVSHLAKRAPLNRL